MVESGTRVLVSLPSRLLPPSGTPPKDVFHHGVSLEDILSILYSSTLISTSYSTFTYSCHSFGWFRLPVHPLLQYLFSYPVLPEYLNELSPVYHFLTPTVNCPLPLSNFLKLVQLVPFLHCTNFPTKVSTSDRRRETTHVRHHPQPSLSLTVWSTSLGSFPVLFSSSIPLPLPLLPAKG